MEVSRRYRIKVARNAKGIWVPECSVEFTAVDEPGTVQPHEYWRELTLSESDAMVEALNKRYPPEVKGE